MTKNNSDVSFHETSGDRSEKPEKTTTNWYEQQQEAKRLHYQNKALQAEQKSINFYQASNDAVAGIPPGQPVLVGHHSEKRHRRALSQSWDKMGKSVEAANQAKYYEDKAAAVGTGGISSDDPQAISKLEQQLNERSQRQELMKAANKLIKKGDRDGLLKLGYSQEEVEGLFLPDCWGDIGYPRCKLTNNNASIKRLKKRIDELIARESFEIAEFSHDGLTILHNSNINRILLFFDNKPSKEFRQLLKSNGFKWSPKNNAWQRHLNNSGIYHSNYIKNKFLELTSD